VTGPALSELLSELRPRATSRLDQAELDKGRALLAYRLVDTLSHASQLAGAVAQICSTRFRSRVPHLRPSPAVPLRRVGPSRRPPRSPTRSHDHRGSRRQGPRLPQLAPLSLGNPEYRDPAGNRLP